MEISRPARASLMPKSIAMSVRRPIGMNSEVLKIKAESVIPMSGSHSRKVIDEPSFDNVFA